MEIAIGCDYQKILCGNILVHDKNMFVWKPVPKNSIVGVIYTFFDTYPGIVVDIYLFDGNEYIYHYKSETHFGVDCKIEWYDDPNKYHKYEYASGVDESNEITLDLINYTDKGDIRCDINYTDLKIYDNYGILKMNCDIDMID